MTPEDVADLAESLVPIAGRLIAAVRDDGPAHVARLLAEVPAAHLPALCVVLAAHADPDVSSATALAWVPDVAAPVVPQEALFGPWALIDPDAADAPLRPILRAVAAFPEAWPDDECKRLHKAWRSRVTARARGREEADGDPEREEIGYREWERRRKSDNRSPDRRRDRRRQGGPVTRAAAEAHRAAQQRA